MAGMDWEKELQMLSQCKSSVDTSKIPDKNALCEFEFEEFRDLFLRPTGVKRKADRIVVGLHPPSILPNRTYTETIRETKTMNNHPPSFQLHPKISTKYSDPFDGNQSTTNSVSSAPPPMKKRKFNDWKTGNNKSIGDEMNSNLNERKTRNIASRITKSVRRSSNGSNGGSDNQIPLGLESCFDRESGSLVKELESLDINLVRQIGYDLMSSDTGITFKDIAGLNAEKESIKEAVIWPLRRQDIYASNGLLEPPKGVLLFGPPGTGKTMIAKAIANESGAHFFAFSPSTLMSKWLGESSKLIKSMFAIARYMAPSIVFIDEIDALFGQRQSEGKDYMATLKTQFLMESQGVRSSADDGYVLMVGATNFPESIDQAARRRFSSRLYIPLPDRRGREELFRGLLKKAKGHGLNEEDIQKLVEETEGYSGSDVSDMTKRAAHCPLREVNMKDVQPADIRPLMLEDFLKTMERFRPSVKKEEIRKYEEWRDNFGVL